MKILLAEDDSNISTIAQMALEQLGGHKVTVACDGIAALEIALKEDFDLILLDEMMPRMNGLKVCEELEQLSDRSVPIIFLSAKSSESDIGLFKSAGLGFIPKPFDPTNLANLIEEILQTPMKKGA